jgi:ligand-binding SRPBCC domain-containing protein
LIDYRLKIRGFPAKWRTRISEWQPPFRFVDEQIRGPYRRWHHEHTFEEKDGGTLCRDRVQYDMIGGALINWLLVRRDVETIFAYRRKKLLEIFGEPTPVARAAVAA